MEKKKETTIWMTILLGIFKGLLQEARALLLTTRKLCSFKSL